MKNFFIKLTAQISILALVFCVVVGSFVLCDLLRFSSLEEPAISKLDDIRAEITANPEKAELKEIFVELELVYRRAYFVNDTQITRGGILLLFGLGLFLLSFSLRLYLLQTLPKLPKPDSLKKEDSAEEVFIKVLLSGVAVALVASVIVLVGNSLPSQDETAKIVEVAELEAPKVEYSTQEELYANWTSLRGAANDGIARNFNLPENAKISQAWESPLDIDGFNSVVQFADRFYVSGEKAGARVVKAFDVETGNMIWEKSLTAKVETNYDEQTGPAPSTMSCDAHRAYAIFPSGELVAYTKEGELAWQKKFDLPEINYGYSSSLLITGKSLIVQMSLDESNLIYAIDSASGKELWKASSEVHSASWSSPSLVEFEGKKIIIALTSAEVIAIDLDTGEILWQNECMGGEVASSASYLNGKVYLGNENVAAFAFDVLTGEILWENSSVVLPSISSVSVDEKAMYMYSSGGTVTVLNIEDGEPIYEIDVDEGFNASPLVIGNKVLACDLAGKIFITKQGAEIADSLYDVEEPINATPALVGDKLLLRLESKILCLKVEEAK